jgi:hypothetical protein
MDFKALGKSLLGLSPLVATAIAGPAGGAIATALANLLGVSSESLPSALVADPNIALKLKQFELEHESLIMETLSNNFLAESKDRDSARNMQIELMKLTGKRDWILSALTIIFTVGFFGSLGLMLFAPYEMDKGIFHDLLNAETIILMFYFGGMFKGNLSK